MLLRFTDLSFPDFDTDEAQAALGVSAAWTPVGMMIFRFAQTFFGHEIVVVRSISAMFGVALLPLLYLLAKRYTEKDGALLITATAALFPSHILFSRLAYLSTQLLFAWTLTLYCFLRARETNDPPRSSVVPSEVGWLVVLFLASVYASMIKTQGFVLPFLLAIGGFTEGVVKRATRNDTTWVLLLSLIPVGTYILTHPGIAATLFLYGGGMYGVSGFLQRIVELILTWWRILAFFFIVLIASLQYLRTFDWPFLLLLAIVSAMGLFLGPDHPYYTTDLVLFALPIGLAFSRLTLPLRNCTLCILLGTTLVLLGPRSLTLSPWTVEPFQSDPYWNTHAKIINGHVRGEEAVTVFGYPGHQMRWYLEPHVLVGRNVTPPYPTRYLLILQDPATARTLGSIVYEDEKVAIVRQQE